MRPASYFAAIVKMFFLLFISSTEAEQPSKIPRYDVEAYCYEVSRSKTFLSTGFWYDACFDIEQMNYDWLKKRWSLVSDSSRQNCIESVAADELPTYRHLYACLRTAEKNAEILGANEFEY